MRNKFNPEEYSSVLQYLDGSNLYGWAMIQLLPTRGFNWVDPNEFIPDKIDSYANCDSKGCQLEVDVRYPNELHDLYNNFLFMCEKMKITKVEKLVPNLHNKKNYVIHLRALNQALKHGLILEK